MHHPSARRLCAALLAFMPAAGAAPAPGTLLGQVTLTPVVTQANSYAYGVALQSDGTAIAAGSADNGSNQASFAMARYKADGSLDTGFGPAAQYDPSASGQNAPAAGTVTTGIGPSSSEAHGLVIQPDGKIVLVGQAIDDTTGQLEFAAARYAADGTLDTGFSGGQPAQVSTGKIGTPIGSAGAQAFAVALQGDGKLVAVGAAGNGHDKDFALARYDTIGMPDPGFGNGGTVTGDVRGGDDGIYAVAVQPDGRIVTAGYSFSGTNGDFAVARYTADGQLDSTFNGGVVTTDFGTGNEYAYALALQPDGKIVVAGYTAQGLAVARYTTGGVLDAGFGSGGKVMTALAGSTNARAYAVVIQPDGAIVVGGTDGDRLALVRYLPDGSLDPGFGSGGEVFTSAGTASATIKALAVTPGGVIVASGYADDGTQIDFLLARYQAVAAPWQLKPDAFAFTSAGAAPVGDFVTSDTVTIGGLDAGVAVPVVVGNGQFINQSEGQYSSERGWARNGDRIAVRQVAVNGTATTTLTVGGIAAPNNNALTLGTAVAAPFTASGIAGTSSGGMDPAALGLLAALAALRRRRAG